MSILKTCPFCGGEVDIWFDPETYTYKVRCFECDCVVAQYYGCIDEAIEAWNRRATEKGGAE